MQFLHVIRFSEFQISLFQVLNNHILRPLQGEFVIYIIDY